MGDVHVERREFRAHRSSGVVVARAAPELREGPQARGGDGRRRRHAATPARIGKGRRLAAAVRQGLHRKDRIERRVPETDDARFRALADHPRIIMRIALTVMQESQCDLA